MDDEVLVQVQNGVQGLHNDALDVTLRKKLAVDVQHVNEMAEIHLTILKN